MAMNQVPTLVLGIGGLGCKIAAHVSDLLSEEDRKYVAVVGMDTNVNDLRKLGNHNMKVIRTSDDRLVEEFLKVHPEYLSWFPDNKFLRNRGMNNGAGQIRAISRMAGLAAMENRDMRVIDCEIQRIAKLTPKSDMKGNLTVMVVGSDTGGTAGGLFIPMPYYIREYMRQNANQYNVILRGMFMGPDLTANVQPSITNENAVRVNGYACLKELNAFYLMQRDGMNYPLELENYTPGIPGDNIPYDYLYLIEKSNSAGTIGEADLNSIVKQIAKMVFTLMFTPVGTNSLSVEDNLVLQAIEKSGMNRYSGAGLCRLEFRCDVARNYVTLRAVQDLVQNEWLLLDEKYEAEVRQCRLLQRTDPSVKVRPMKEVYTSEFRAAAEPGGKLAFLKNEAFIQEDDSASSAGSDPSVLPSRMSSFMDVLHCEVEKVAASDAVVQAGDRLAVDKNEMKDPNTAESHISAIYSAADSMRKLVRQLEADHMLNIANTLFPPDWSLMEAGKDDKRNIYHWLSNVHPITARFLCYDLMLLLEDEIERQESDKSAAKLNYLEAHDFDLLEPDCQTAAEALANIRSHKHGDKRESLLKRMIGAVTGNKKALDALTDELTREARKHANHCVNYLTASVTLNTCKTLLARVKTLAENYELFFSTIRRKIDLNKEQIQNLETSGSEDQLGVIGVYSSPAALKHMYEEYMARRDDSLPDHTKETVFLQIYQFFSQDEKRKTDILSQAAKRKAVAAKQVKISSMFQSAVVSSMETDVAEHGEGIVTMSVRQALLKEMELVTGVTEADFEGPAFVGDEYKKKSIAYIKEKIEGAFDLAMPMLATDQPNRGDATGSAYMAINPSCAETDNRGEPDVSATAAAYLPQKSVHTGNQQAAVLIDPEFSPYEIICFRAAYSFVAEDLIKYRMGSDNELAYRQRIDNVRRMDISEVDEETVATIICPHLNKNWHEEAFLPPLTGEERRQSEKLLRMAFIYALGRRLFRKALDEDSDDELLIWHFGASPIRKCGAIIDSSYTALYSSLAYNGRMKEMILTKADEMKAEKKRSLRDFEDETRMLQEVMQHEFVVNLCGAGPQTANLLDILLTMREGMEDGQWNKLFIGLRDTLWDYCSYLFDGRPRLVNKVTRAIVKALCETSHIGFLLDAHGKPVITSEEGPLLAENAKRGAVKVQDRIKKLLDAEYIRQS